MIGTLRQIIDDMEHGIYDFTKDGKCIGCGKCCSNLLPLSNAEIKDIKRYMRQHHVKEQKHILLTRKPNFDLTCPFLNENGGNEKCTIYPVRPHICRVFQCNQPPSTIKENKERFWKMRKLCDMRETFFGKSYN